MDAEASVPGHHTRLNKLHGTVSNLFSLLETEFHNTLELVFVQRKDLCIQQ